MRVGRPRARTRTGTRTRTRTRTRTHIRALPRASSLRGFLLLALAVPCLVGWSFFDLFHENVEKGNRQADEGNADAALQHYGEAARVNPSSPIPDFNRGRVLAGQGEADAALDAFRAAGASPDPAIAADALYNMGNVQLEKQEFEPAIESYLQSLDLDPTDEDARRNFEIAVQRLQEQQQQQQQDPNQDQDENNDEQQDQEQKPQEPQDEEDEQDEDPQDQSQDEQPQDQEEEAPEPEPQPQEDRLSREDAERLLNAVQSDELKVLEQLQQKEPPAGVVTHDW